MYDQDGPIQRKLSGHDSPRPAPGRCDGAKWGQSVRDEVGMQSGLEQLGKQPPSAAECLTFETVLNLNVRRNILRLHLSQDTLFDAALALIHGGTQESTHPCDATSWLPTCAWMLLLIYHAPSHSTAQPYHQSHEFFTKSQSLWSFSTLKLTSPSRLWFRSSESDSLSRLSLHLHLTSATSISSHNNSSPHLSHSTPWIFFSPSR